MKRKLFFLLCALLGFVTSVKADKWTAPTVPAVDIESIDGTTYLYNVEADAFYRRGLTWNTRSVATRLHNGDNAASNVTDASHAEYSYTVSDGTVKIMYNGSQGLGSNLYVDNGTPVAFTYAETQDDSKIYTLTYGGNQLVLAWNHGGPLVFSNVSGAKTDRDKWAFIPEINVTNGEYALYKAKKEMYAIYEQVVDEGLDTHFASALATAYTAYSSGSATASTVKAASKTLLAAVRYAISSPVSANMFFTNPDMCAVKSYSDWTNASLADNQYGMFAGYHQAFTLTQTANDVPNGNFTVSFRSLTTKTGAKLELKSGESDEDAYVPLRENINFQNVDGEIRFYQDMSPNDTYKAAQGLLHDDAVATISDFSVSNNSLKITVTETETNTWCPFMNFDIAYSGISTTDLIAETFTVKKEYAESLYETPMDADVLDNLKAKANVSITSSNTRLEIITASEELQDAIDAALVSIDMVRNVATSFTSGGSATNDEWYAFEVPSTGWYTITPSVAGTFSHTQDGSQAFDSDFPRFYATTTGKYQYLTSGTFYFKTNTTAATVTIATTSISPDADVTGYINDPSFEHVALSSSGTTTSTDFMDWAVTSGNGVAYISNKEAASRSFSGVDGNNLYETWHTSDSQEDAFLLKQTLSNLPIGMYKLTCYVASNASNNVRVAFGSEYVDIPCGTNKGTGHQASVDLNNTSVGDVLISLTSNKWFKADDFKLKFLGYPVNTVAVELPVSGEMSADTWYYKDVTTTGIHAFSASDLDNIVYTTDGTAYIHDISTTLPQNFLNSASTRYYFKSSSDQTLTISKICDNFSYWFLRTSDYKYLSRGGNYNAQAVADNYGLPVRIAYENNNINFIFVDNWRYLFDAGSGNLYEDTDQTTYVNFAIEPTDGGYYIVNKNTTSSSTNGQKLYIYTNDGNRVKMSNSNATVWVLESVSGDAHKTRMQVLKDAQATSVATSADITWTSTQAELDSYLSQVTSENISITTTGLREAYEHDAANNGPYVVFSETVSGLSAGLYKLSVKAFERITSNNDTYDKAEGNAGLAYLYAGDQKVQLWSVFDFPADAAYSTQNVEKGGKNYPNGTTSAQVAFDAGKYVNKVFVWVSGGSLEIGIKIPQSYQNNTHNNTRQNWVCCNNYSLTYYGNANTIPATIGSNGFTTFASEYPLDMTLENMPDGVRAFTASISGNTVSFTKLDQTVPAKTGVLLASTDELKGKTIQIPVVASGDAVEGNAFYAGTGKLMPEDDSNYYFALKKNAEELTFGKFIQTSVIINTNKAYFTIPTNVYSGRLVVNFDDETAINVIEAAETETEGLKDGKYLENGQIVIVKNGVKYSANGQKLN